jgi:hypothetical protein
MGQFCTSEQFLTNPIDNWVFHRHDVFVFATAPSSRLGSLRSVTHANGTVVVGSDRFHRARAAVVAAVLGGVAVASVVAFVAGRQHTGVYLGGIGVVIAAGWVAAFVEGWTFSETSIAQRRPLFSTNVKADEVRSVRLVHDEFRHEIVISTSKWFGVEVPLGMVGLDAPAVRALTAFLNLAERHGASVDPSAKLVLAGR